MQYAMIYAFVVVASAPFIGIWRGHVWARSNGKLLVPRKSVSVIEVEVVEAAELLGQR
jgi:hypothetical protein